MSENIDDLTVGYEEGGAILVKEIDKVILSRGAWVTILFRYSELNKNSGEYGLDKFNLRRYQKRNGAYQLKSKFAISSRDQAQKIVDGLNTWLLAPEEKN
jgi:hypothetical protein